MLNIYESVLYLPVSIQIQDKCSALLLASKNGHIKVVKFLFEKGGKINDKNKVRYISTTPSLFIICSLHPLHSFTYLLQYKPVIPYIQILELFKIMLYLAILV